MLGESVDILQLPIPDWGLQCPRCRYALLGLPSHRCPECGLSLDMREVVKPWTRLRPPRFDGTERPLPDYGFDCAECGASLAGARSDCCNKCETRFDLHAIVPKSKWFAITAAAAQPLTLGHLETMFLAEQLPHVPIDQRTLHEHLLGQQSIGSNLLVPREFWFEVRWLIGGAARDLHAIRTAPKADWKCATCGEDVPANFELCWNCGSAQESHLSSSD